MMKTKIVLKASCKKDAYCDRNEYFKKYGEYDGNGCFKKMQNGAPLVINIDGTYYFCNKLIPSSGCVAFDDYCRELKTPSKGVHPPVFIWR